MYAQGQLLVIKEGIYKNYYCRYDISTSKNFASVYVCALNYYMDVLKSNLKVV